MATVKCLRDAHAVIRDAAKDLPNESLKIKFLEALAELEDNTKPRLIPRSHLR